MHPKTNINTTQLQMQIAKVLQNLIASRVELCFQNSKDLVTNLTLLFVAQMIFLINTKNPRPYILFQNSKTTQLKF